MKKLKAILLIVIGIVLIIISIMALVRAFDVFSLLKNDVESFGYVFGSVVVPLFITVLGRWLFRKGMKILRS